MIEVRFRDAAPGLLLGHRCSLHPGPPGGHAVAHRILPDGDDSMDWCPRPESNRHDPGSRDFRTTSTFAAILPIAGCSWSAARLHRSLAALGARRLLSTPSRRCMSGLARRWLGYDRIQGFRRI